MSSTPQSEFRTPHSPQIPNPFRYVLRISGDASTFLAAIFSASHSMRFWRRMASVPTSKASVNGPEYQNPAFAPSGFFALHAGTRSE